MEKKIRIAIVEDEKREQELLSSYVRQFATEQQLEVELTLFSDGIGIACPYRGGFDIILLDIQMKHMDGLKAARLIREKDEEVVLIFISNLVQYAIRGYAVRAMNFVVKPISYFAFCEEMKNALTRLKKQEGRPLMLRTEDGIVKLRPEQLVYAETVGRKIVVHSEKEEWAINGTVKKLEEDLGDRRFFRCHSGFLVNLYYIDRLGAASAVIAGREIPVSRHRKKEFEEALIRILGEEL